MIRDGGASGLFPGQIHEGVAWWIGACLVVVLKTTRLVVAHDGHPTSATFHERLCRGAINAQHFACRVTDLRTTTEAELLSVMSVLGNLPGALIATTTTEDGEIVNIALYDVEGKPLTEHTGLATIRRLIADDHVPIPVNNRAKGLVVHHAEREKQA
ncbi:hypothetical protein K4749_31600 [Streptomyces sp. TRM72054]|uniref:hypothetical protein n=1 Tax=unclassified Streptomyces TaxID=2593676 RepID=UPI0014880745|nr:MULTISPECIES: hypothetical protein [unclassified Streptomyces]MBX9398011.1 hypothetical protein [Streptomyces sp. TRM72054]